MLLRKKSNPNSNSWHVPTHRGCDRQPLMPQRRLGTLSNRVIVSWISLLVGIFLIWDSWLGWPLFSAGDQSLSCGSADSFSLMSLPNGFLALIVGLLLLIINAIALYLALNQSLSNSDFFAQLRVILISKTFKPQPQSDLELQTLKASEVLLSEVLNNAITAVARFRMYPNREWEYEYYSPGCEVIFGYTPEEFTQQQHLWMSRILPQDIETVVLPVFDEILNGRTTTIEFRFRHKNESVRWISDTLTSQWDDTEKCWIVTCVETDITDRKQAEAALTVSEARFRAIVQNSFDMIQLFNADWIAIYQNPAVERILGYPLRLVSLAEVVAKINPEDRLPVEQAIATLSQQPRQPATLEYRIQRADGTWAWLESIATNWLDHPDVSAIVINSREITDRKQAEAALKVSEDRFRATFEQVAVGISHTDLEGRFTWVNRKLCEITGYSTAELLSMTYQDLTHPDDLTSKAELIHLMLTGQIEQYSLEKRDLRKRGDYVWVQLTTSLVRDSQDQPQYFVTVIKDITHRKQTEAALQRSEARFRAIFEQAAVGIVQISLTGEYLRVNQRFCELVGYTEAELRTKTFQEITEPEDLEYCQRSIEELRTSDRSTCAIEKRYRCQNGRLVWANVSISLVRDAIMNPQYYICVIEDIRDRKAAEAALRQQAKKEQALNRLIQIIRSSLDLSTIFSTAATEISRFLDVHCTQIVQYQPDRGIWLIVADYCQDSRSPSRLGLEISDAGDAITDRLKQIEVIDSYDTKNCEDEINRYLAEEFSGKGLIVPLRVGEGVWGYLSLSKSVSHAWQASEVEIAGTVADQLAIAIQQCQLYQQLETANQELQSLISIDSLTQVANRRRFDEHLHQEWTRLAQEQLPLALILCDVDYFKRYNDTYGHQAGDECLQKVAHAMRCAVKNPADLVARYGGEEFAVILPNTTLEGALSVAEMIRQQVSQFNIPHAASAVSDRITVSLGVACTIPDLQKSPQSLILGSDEALYQAKHLGRNRAIAHR